MYVVQIDLTLTELPASNRKSTHYFFIISEAIKLISAAKNLGTYYQARTIVARAQSNA